MESIVTVKVQPGESVQVPIVLRFSPFYNLCLIK